LKALNAAMKILFPCLMAVVLASHAVGADNGLKEEMRLKLFFAQSILEGIATENFDLIATNAYKLKTFSQRPVWDVRQTPEYRRLTTDFQRSVDGLSRAAAKRNVDAATVAYFQLTTSCVTCHKYLRGAEVSNVSSPQVQGLASSTPLR
jgi:hypothetical protein